MIMLLGTYTTENASQAREEAQRCIVASLADPQTFLLDHLLQLKPVKFLEGELIHDLLKVSSKLFPSIFEFTVKSNEMFCRSSCQRSWTRTSGFTTATAASSTDWGSSTRTT